MHGTAVDPLSSGHHDVAEDARLARAQERKWPVGSTILLMIAISAFLWAAIYLGAQQVL
jgi:hypothetical protein